MSASMEISGDQQTLRDRGFSARLAVFLPLALLCASLGLYANRDLWQMHADNSTGNTLSLLPVTIAGAVPVKHWYNPRPGGTIEQGALYRVAGDSAANDIQLDFYRNDFQPHRGIGCYLTQGESLVSEQLRNVTTAGGLVQFDVGLLRSRDQLRLVATTECRADGCSEQRLYPEHAFIGLSWHSGSRWLSAHQGVVPTAVMLRRTLHGDDADMARTQLEAQFQQVSRQIDLTPACTLARMESKTTAVTP